MKTSIKEKSYAFRHFGKTKIFRILIVFSLVLLVFVVSTVYFRKNVVPVVMDSSISKVRAVGTNAINSAATSVLNAKITYDDLFSIVQDKNGDIVMIKANSPSINSIARQIANLAQANLDALDTEEISIAFGTFTGLALLTGLGPQVSIKITPIGSANCDFVSEFISSGINQTLHKIYINVFSDISIITPLDEASVSVKAEILVCENVIVGKVPDTYGNMSPSDSFFDLLPN